MSGCAAAGDAAWGDAGACDPAPGARGADGAPRLRPLPGTVTGVRCGGDAGLRSRLSSSSPRLDSALSS